MLAALAGALLLAGCGLLSSTVEQAPEPTTAPATAPAPAAAGSKGATIERGIARWQAANWSELPGWQADAVVHAWPALVASCARPAPGWAEACAGARRLAQADEAALRAWLQATLAPWRVEGSDGGDVGLATGYFEPLVEASRARRGAFTVPLYAPPADLATRKPWYTRSEIETLPAARAALRGREIAYVADPLDALMLQVQGSGRLRLVDERDASGQPKVIRAAFAGHNDRPYQSVGRWLVERGAFTLEQASWPAIKAWARQNPQQVPQMLAANPRMVFFREEALADASVGPLGAQGVPLTPGRSIAVDKRSVPYGTPVWLDTTEPQPWSPNPPPARPLQRLVIAQDTGSAITGAVRADYFWGWGDGAEDRAGRMKQPLRMWVLWPKGQAVPPTAN
ncbi:murein transglycosylase A [Caldimonas sp. KR1-144]|uniref:murein transglycosylase A n=1 Tax=Caldimonas sp. KR1-144 TaxID=3400911 RepID=UPI003C054A83